MKLSEHFTSEELTVTDTGLSNEPGEHIHALTATAAYMEMVRALLGNKPILINSAFRSQKVNEKVGGSATSAHCKGYAVDFVCPEFGTPEQVVHALRGKLKYDQLIWEHPRGKAWVHISFDPRFRKQTLEFTGKNYLPLR